MSKFLALLAFQVFAAGVWPCLGNTSQGGSSGLGCDPFGDGTSTLTAGSFHFNGAANGRTLPYFSGVVTASGCYETAVLETADPSLLPYVPVYVTESEISYDPCCGNGLPPSASPGGWGYDPVTFTDVSSVSFTTSAQLAVDHFSIYSFVDGSNVLNSGSLTGSNSTFVVSNSSLVAGRNYAITACTADNLIQGSACFQATAGAIIPLQQFAHWNNDTNSVLGRTIYAAVSTNQAAVLVQDGGGYIAYGTASISFTPAPTIGIAPAGNQAAIYWPASATNFVLQSTTSLISPNWVTVSNGTPITGVLLSHPLPAAYYRLQSQP